MLLYDLTSTYFETDEDRDPDDLRQFGYSRDKRGDCRQVVIALIVTPEGYPLPPRTYRFITAWDSIWHVPLQDQRALMLKLMGMLEPEGVLAFSAGGLDVPSEHVDATMGRPTYYSTLGIPGLLQVTQDSGCICRHLEFDQHPQSHLFVVVQRRA